MAGTPLCLRALPPFLNHAPSRCLCSCDSVTPGGERSGAGGRTCRSRPGGKGLGGNGLGGLVWVWVGVAWARYFALSLPTAAAAAAAGEASAARAGFLPRLRSVLGVAAWPAEAVARPARGRGRNPSRALLFLRCCCGSRRRGVRGPCGVLPSLARRAGGRGVAGRGGGAARRGRGRNPSRALLVLRCCCGGRRRGARGLCGVRPPRSRRAGDRGVAGRGGVAARRGRGRSPLPALLALLRCCGGRRRGAPGPCGVCNRFRGVLGVAAWSAEAVVRPAGAAVAIRRAPFLLSSAAAAALGDAPGSCAGATPRVGGVPGAAVGAAAWLAGAAVSASCVSGAPSWGGAAGLAAWAAEAVISAGSGSRARGGGPTSTAASAGLRSSRSARVSPVHSGEEAGERERDRRWWRSSRWGDLSESAITVILVGMRGGRRALPTTSWCISAVP